MPRTIQPTETKFAIDELLEMLEQEGSAEQTREEFTKAKRAYDWRFKQVNTDPDCPRTFKDMLRYDEQLGLMHEKFNRLGKLLMRQETES